VNKKIGIVIGVIVLGMIFVVSDINFEDGSEEIPQVEIVKETETMIIMPVKAARPDCGPNDECYIPSKITIKPGETVYWKNQDAAFHSVTSGFYDDPDGLFDSELLDPEDIFSYKFTEEGIYDYYCTLHPWMKGIILVER
jgi:plastocyanin